MINQGRYIISAILICFLVAIGILFSKFFEKNVFHNNDNRTVTTIDTFIISRTSEIEQGRTLFNTNCGKCHHAFNPEFPLSETIQHDQWRDSLKLIEYIRFPEHFEDDPYVKGLRKVWESRHPSFPELSFDNTRFIIQYLRKGNHRDSNFFTLPSKNGDKMFD